MLGKLLRARVLFGVAAMIAVMAVSAACAAADTPTPVVIEKEVIKEVEVVKEVIKEVEVVKEVVVVATVAAPREGGQIINYKYGTKPSSFSEAPELAALVAQGKLPPVEQRLPEDPLVVEGPDGIGRYGGTYRWVHERGDTGWVGYWHDAFVVKTMDGKEIMPHVAKSWDISSDSKTYTFKLRKGRWSDGTPFTADDYEFGWNDIMANTDMYPNPSTVYQFDGVLGEFTKLDDYTVQYTFPVTYPTFLNNLEWQGWGAGRNGYFIYAPKHYLSQFHPDYVSKAEMDKMISDAGVDEWYQLFRQKSNWTTNVEMPLTNPWVTTAPFGQILWKNERNPYFMTVDTAGNQLPYIGKRVGQSVDDHEIMQLKFMAGEADLGDRGVDAAKLVMFMVNKDKQGYEVIFRPRESSYFLLFNLTYDADPEIRKWLINKEFRRAISLGLNRDKTHAVVTNTLGEARQSVPPYWSPYYMGPEYDNKNMKFDPDEANRILDSLGLTERDADGFRLRSDGKGTLTFLLFGAGNRTPSLSGMAELMAQDLGDIGIKTNLKTTPGSTWLFKNESQLTVAGFFGADPWRWGWIPRQKSHSQAALIGDWIVSKGEEGVDPNTDPAYAGLARSIDLWEQGKPMSIAERVDLTREIAKIYVDNYYLTGIVGNVPGVMLVNKKLRNVPLGPSIGQILRELYFFTE